MTKRLIKILLLPLMIAVAVASAQDTTTPLTVTYVANEGFIVECEDHKIAIDAFFGGPEASGYVQPSDSIIQLMKTAQPPFDNIDIIAVTHFHHDHMNPGILVSHLLHDTGAILVCTPQVVEKLAEIKGMADVINRIRPITGPNDSTVMLSIDGIDLKILPGEHGSYFDLDEATGATVNIHRDVQHLEYLVSMCGRTVYHSGDSPLNDMERYWRHGLGQGAVDLALVQWFTPGENISFKEKLVREAIGADEIILMHFSASRDISDPEIKKACAERKITIPQHCLETFVIP